MNTFSPLSPFLFENEDERNYWAEWIENSDQSSKIAKENDELKGRIADMQRHITLLQELVLQDSDGPIPDESLLDSAPASVQIIAEFLNNPEQQQREATPPFYGAPASVEMEPQPELQDRIEPYQQQHHFDQNPHQQQQQPPYFGQNPQQQQQPQYFGQNPQQQQQPLYFGQNPQQQQYAQPLYQHTISNFHQNGLPEQLSFISPPQWHYCVITFH
uniref:Uncharacterized protein n=1 Tax=Panagrolaimus sp. PS1159 TaxID=55785 RepID=A0AC35F460_9BILA